MFIKNYSKEDVIKSQYNAKKESENARLLYDEYHKNNTSLRKSISIEDVITAQKNAYETAENARVLYEQYSKKLYNL